MYISSSDLCDPLPSPLHNIIYIKSLLCVRPSGGLSIGMNQLSPLQNILFQVGGLLLVAGAIMPMIPPVSTHAAMVFTIGALLFGGLQFVQRIDESAVPDRRRWFVVRRLRHQQLFGATLLIVTSGLMLMQQYHIGPIRGSEWKLTLLIAVILEVYTAFRIPQEMNK